MLKLSKESILLLKKCLQNQNKKLFWIIDSKILINIDVKTGETLRDAIN